MQTRTAKPLGLSAAFIGLIMVLHVGALRTQEIPNCDFEDTVNLTDSRRFENGSYSYEGVLVPAHLVGVYDYEVLFQGHRNPVASHVRGCVCQIKACVKFCCHPKQMKKEDSSECSSELADELSYSPFVNVTLKNGTRRAMHVLEEFVVQQGIPCYDGYIVSPELDEDMGWDVFENGTLYRHYDAAYLSKRDYCFSPHKLDDEGIYILNPINCPVPNELPINNQINNYAMAMSVPFIVLTILVYLFIPELRNLHGKCLISYLSSLAVGYSIITFISLTTIVFEYVPCILLGYFGYFTFMSAFFWLSVISFDLWQNFRGTNSMRFTQKKRFFIYSLYAWGVPILLTILTILAQSSDLDYSLKPGIGDDYCWIKTNDWSAMIYFFGPNLIIILFNTVMFTLTTLKIYKIQRELMRVVEQGERARHLRSHKDNVGLFLRLFIVMGVSWLLDIVSYMVGPDSWWSWLFYASDLCNALQGILIFVLFVLKAKVRRLLKKRMDPKGTTELTRTNRTNTFLSNASRTQLTVLLPRSPAK